MPHGPTPLEDPRTVYERRWAERHATAAQQEARERRASNLRLAVFVLLLAALAAGIFAGTSGHLAWPPLAAFAWLVVLQARASARADRARAARRLYEDGRLRLDGAWAGRGRSGEDLAPPDHLYAADLDLFGAGSVFELLCSARTRGGERRLADWLLAPAAPAAVRERQAAVAELAPRLDLREDLAILEGGARGALERGAIAAWAREPRHLQAGWALHAQRALALASTALLVAWLAFGLPPGWMLLSMVAQYVLAARDRARVHAVLEGVDRPAQDLALAGRILERLEGERFTCPHLRGLAERVARQGGRPVAAIRRLAWIVDLVDARRNQVFLPLSWLGSLGTQWAYAIEAWRAEHAEPLCGWLDVVSELEALCSLATYAFERPADPFPELVDVPCFEAEGLGHPLLPDAANVRNDLSLAAGGPAPQAILVSGSNMSGKSTLLRSVGVAQVLAFAGAPVRARRLRAGPLAVGASIQLHDSLREGASRFYAEIERLRAIVDLLGGERTALFLVDEILHGTNSRDRRLGAAAVLRTLLAGGALGLVTTHDLALAAIAEETGGRLVNMHFEDQVEDGRIAFDYRLRPGVVTRGNALALMRMVGLDVSPGAEDAGT